MIYFLQQDDKSIRQGLLKNKDIEKWFEWKLGAKRFTFGIDITTEPFILNMGRSQKQKVMHLEQVWRLSFNHIRF